MERVKKSISLGKGIAKVVMAKEDLRSVHVHLAKEEE
jgi:hypothetical protein